MLQVCRRVACSEPYLSVLQADHPSAYDELAEIDASSFEAWGKYPYRARRGRGDVLEGENMAGVAAAGKDGCLVVAGFHRRRR